MKKISLFLFALIIALSGLAFPRFSVQSVNADEGLTFRGWGDSIAAGDTLEDNENYIVGQNITEGCFTDVFSKHYINELGGSAVNFAQSGDKTSDMVTKLAPYTNSSASDYIAFRETDVMTVCIGANNVLTPAVNALGSYILNFGDEEEQQFRATLQQGLDDFENDYLNTILPTFKSKTKAQIYVMTIYNPYKYSSFDQVDFSQVPPMMQMFKGVISQNFQTMLSIAMEYLEQMNDIIRDNIDNQVHCVEIHDLFETFTEQQYKQYINADFSQIVLTNSMLTELMGGNTSSINAYIDPHPTLEGQRVIGEEYIKNYVYSVSTINTELSGEFEKDDLITFAISTIGGTSQMTYKLIKKSSQEELYVGTVPTCQVSAQRLGASGVVYFEVYNGFNKVGVSNEMSYSITIKNVPDEPQEPEEPDEPNEPEDPETPTDPSRSPKEQNSKTIVIAAAVVSSALAAAIVIFFIIKSLKL